MSFAGGPLGPNTGLIYWRQRIHHSVFYSSVTHR
jgi:hypothetical protein